jgi:D-amino-acid oxidase
MNQPIAVIGAGVSGLTCAVVLAEQGFPTTIFADETGPETTSAAAGAIWFPYDVEPLDRAIAWALESYQTFRNLGQDAETGVSMIELRTFCRAGTISIPEWARKLGAAVIDASGFSSQFVNGFGLTVPLIDTTVYLPYLARRHAAAGGVIHSGVRFTAVGEVPSEFAIVVNCAGIGARTLLPDNQLEPHRGQVVIVSKLDLPAAIVCDDAPLMYAIPRTNDTLFGGTNEVNDSRQPDPKTTAAILEECSRVLHVSPPKILAERVGLRPFRRSGVRLETDRLGDGRRVVHNYGHGGAGFTLSWGCAKEVLRLVTQYA